LIPVLPMGIGIRYPISSRISINAETSYRFTFTDYLDGFSKAANDSRRDSYLSHTVGLIYKFRNNLMMKCPSF
jgi:outer membrane receptor protein involved in Fe transport